MFIFHPLTGTGNADTDAAPFCNAAIFGVNTALAPIGISSSKIRRLPSARLQKERGGGERVRADTVERKMEEHFNSMIQQRYQFPQMAGWLLLTYIGGE